MNVAPKIAIDAAPRWISRGFSEVLRAKPVGRAGAYLDLSIP